MSFIPHPHVLVDSAGIAVLSDHPDVKVAEIFRLHRSGTAVTAIVRRYPSLGIAAILDALAFGYDNPSFVRKETTP